MRLDYAHQFESWHRCSGSSKIDVQSEILDGLDSRIVIPLRRLAHFPKVNLPSRLMPILKIEGEDFLLETPKMGAVPKCKLSTPWISVFNGY
jgi:toxin CcdB